MLAGEIPELVLKVRKFGSCHIRPSYHIYHIIELANLLPGCSILIKLVAMSWPVWMQFVMPCQNCVLTPPKFSIQLHQLAALSELK